MRFSKWSSLTAITDEGRSPETGWLRSYLVLFLYVCWTETGNLTNKRIRYSFFFVYIYFGLEIDKVLKTFKFHF